MEAFKFNPYDWIPKQEKQPEFRPLPQSKSNLDIENDIDVIVCRIESYKIDLTLNYADWLSIGFSLADALGESGRGYFHRVSRFHSDYDFQTTNMQFDKCLKRQKSGYSIKTFFFLAQSAGIDIRVNKHQISRS
jgi:Primase C terminal 2 (PriCT-2)